MKKRIIFMLMITFFISSLISGSYIINSPTPGEKWVKYGIHKIKWLTLGEKPPQIMIFLYNKEGKRKIKEISKNSKNTGEFICSFDTFKDIPNGKYRIFILSPIGKILGKSEVFKIVEKDENPPTKEQIKIKIPLSPIFVEPGKTLHIEWETKEKLPKNFILELYSVDKTKKIKEIKKILPPAMGLPDKKPILKKHFSFNWKVPINIPCGTYVIKITVPHKNIETYSLPISINKERIKKELKNHRER